MKKQTPFNLNQRAVLAALMAAIQLPLLAALELGSDFTYQGLLSDEGAPANGVYDLQFTLYNAVTVGAPVGVTTTVADLAISNGFFTVTISPGANTLNGAALWLQIAVRPGDSVGAYAEISPRQPIVATPYAVTAGALAGNGSVGSAQLADTVELGASNAVGRLDLYHTPAQTASITLFGTGGQISTYGDDGLEQVRIGNNTFGEVRLNNSLANNATAAQLSANAGLGGYLSLNNSNGTQRAYLSGGNSGGVLQLSQADGGIGVIVDGDSSGAGLIQVRNTNGFDRVTIDGQSSSAGGEITVSSSGGNETVQLLGQTTVNLGGSLTLRQDNGTIGAYLQGEAGSNGDGGALTLYNGSGNTTLRLDGDFNNSGSAYLHKSNGQLLVSMFDSAGAGMVTVHDAAGSAVIQLDGDDPAGGGRVTTDRLRTGGNVGIGRDNTANMLEVQGNASKSVAGDWLANSDARIKTDVQTVTGGLETLSRVRLVNFRYTKAYRAAHPEIADQRYLNVIAQEFRQVFPNHVKSSGEKLPDGSEILQVDTYPLTIYSAAAVQELNEELKLKQAELEVLKQTVTELCRTVSAIEKKLEQGEK